MKPPAGVCLCGKRSNCNFTFLVNQGCCASSGVSCGRLSAGSLPIKPSCPHVMKFFLSLLSTRDCGAATCLVPPVRKLCLHSALVVGPESSALLLFAKPHVWAQWLLPLVALFPGCWRVLCSRLPRSSRWLFRSPAQGRRSGLSRARRPRPGSLCLLGPPVSVPR